ncbi:MAG: manganese efflux pump MntP family protein, partial [Mucinivorans sp.]
AMPLFGWALAWNFHHQIARWDHWIAFSLLWILGIKMIYDSFAAKSDEPSKGDMLNLGQSVLMGVATSIDAIIAGVTMALVSITILPAEFSQFGNVVLSCGIISMVTFSASILGLLLGRSSRHSVGRHASVVGGVVLMAIGLKVLVEHLTT